MKVLITGATGFLGQAIVQACRDAGYETVAFSRHASRSPLPGTLVDGDVRDPDALARAVRDCDALIHSAALVAVWRPNRREFDEVNVGGLRHALAAARAARITRIVYTSSFLALPPAGAAEPGLWNDYQRTKAVAEREAARAVHEGMPLVRVYPGVIYGPGPLTEGNLLGRQLADHLAGKLPGVIGADRIWSFSYVSDVARGHVAALEHGQPGSCYQLGGENATQMAPYEIVREMTGRALPRRLPAVAGTIVGALEEARVRLTGGTPLLTMKTVKVLTHDWPLDSAPAVRDLGYTMTPLRVGLERVLAAEPLRSLTLGRTR